MFAVAGVAAGATSWHFGQSQNFDVFHAASRALLRGDDLYARNAADYFKYSPTFALLFVPFTWGPGWLSALLWSLLNFAVVGWGIDRTLDDPRRKVVAQAIALLGIAVASDGDQSNLLVAGVVLLAFVACEKGRNHVAAHLLAAATLVKIFPLLIAPLVVLRARAGGTPLWRSLSMLALVLLVWTALPLAVASPHELLEQYASWRELIARDHGNHGWSVMSLLQGVGLRWSTLGIQVLGLAVQGTSIVLGWRFGTDSAWRRTLMCSLLCFGVIFNHRAEYTTYAISSVAVGIWYATSTTKPTHLRRALVLLALLAPGPFLVRAEPNAHGIFAFISAHRLYHPLRVFPTLLVWLAMQRELAARFVDVTVRLRRSQLTPVELAGGSVESPHAS